MAKNSFVAEVTLDLQQESLKFNDIWVSWSSPETDQEANHSNLENLKPENATFCQSNF